MDALAGRSPRPQDRLRAWMALGGVVIATAAGPELPREETRELLIAGALHDAHPPRAAEPRDHF